MDTHGTHESRSVSATAAAPVVSRRGLLGGAAGALGAIAATGGAAAHATASPATATGSTQGTAVPTTDLLALSGADQPRWLSVPGSRVVLNPYDFNQTTTEVEQNSGPELPLAAGYYAHNEATRLPSLLMTFRRPPGEPHPEPPPVAFVDDFEALGPDWSLEPGVAASVADSRLTMVLPDSAPDPWGAASHSLTVDLDAYPVVTIDVPSVAGAWALKVNDGTAPVDTVVQGDTTGTGSFSYDLTRVTGWSGTKTFSLRLFVVQRNAPLVVDRISVQSQPTSWLQPASDFSTTWRPEALEFAATYAEGGAVHGRDQFHDRTSVTRALTVAGLGSGASLVLAGRYAGDLSYDSARGVVAVATDSLAYAVAVGAGADVTYYRSEADLRAGGPTVAVPPASGYWSAGLPSTREVVVGVGLAYQGERADAATGRALAAARREGASGDLRRWRAYWNAVLRRVPHPADFTLTAVPDEGVGPDDVPGDVLPGLALPAGERASRGARGRLPVSAGGHRQAVDVELRRRRSPALRELGQPARHRLPRVSRSRRRLGLVRRPDDAGRRVRKARRREPAEPQGPDRLDVVRRDGRPGPVDRALSRPAALPALGGGQPALDLRRPRHPRRARLGVRRVAAGRLRLRRADRRHGRRSRRRGVLAGTREGTGTQLRRVVLPHLRSRRGHCSTTSSTAATTTAPATPCG